MSAYLIVKIEIDDPEIYSEYTARSPAIIEKYGGKFLARGGAMEVLEGENFCGRVVIVEFPDSEAVRNFYNSTEYQEILPIREPISKAQFMLIEGLENTAVLR